METPTFRTYGELVTLDTFEKRFLYLRLSSKPFDKTFADERMLNQIFYRSKEWQDIRSFVITRDLGCDIAMPGYEITGRVYVHHLNPITVDDLHNRSACILDPENLVCVSRKTHEAIHYRNGINLDVGIIERKPNDTCPWR